MALKSILLIEDNADDAALAMRALRKTATLSEIVWAHDGGEALRYLFGAPNAEPGAARHCPTLILLDLRLPDVDGLEVLRRLRAAPDLRCIPVVVLTDSRDPQDSVASYRLGANSYLRKQGDYSRLTEMVEQVRKYWLHINEPPPTCA